MEHINSGRSWSPELRLFLIRCVRPKERLWKKFGSCGQDTDARISLWSAIQEEINQEYGVYVDIEEIKKTWKNLKDNFLRVKKNSNGHGNSKPGAKKWFFFDELKFLDSAEDLTDFKFRTSLFQTLAPDLATEKASVGPPAKKFRSDDRLELIFVPVLSEKIMTKQEVPPGVTVLSLDGDLDKISALTDGLWGTTHPNCVPGAVRTSFEPVSYQNSSLSTATTSILITEEKPLVGFDIGSKQESFPRKEELCSKISVAIDQLRTDYRKAAVIYLSRRKQAAAGVINLMQNFDDYIKRGERRPEEINKVLKYCSMVKQSEFGRVLGLLEQYKDQMEPEGENRKLSTAIDRLKEQKCLNEQRTAELKRDVERIQGELSGQPSVIRRTKLRKTLAEAEEELEKLEDERERFEKTMEGLPQDIFILPKEEVTC